MRTEVEGFLPISVFSFEVQLWGLINLTSLDDSVDNHWETTLDISFKLLPRVSYNILLAHRMTCCWIDRRTGVRHRVFLAAYVKSITPAFDRRFGSPGIVGNAGSR